MFPDGHIGADDSQVVAAAASPEPTSPSDTIDAGALDGWVAYSKICTHAGCSVGLLGIDEPPAGHAGRNWSARATSRRSTRRRRRPEGGPATRSLPQLALAVDGEGFLVAAATSTDAVGPLTWDEA